jgi:hypothetical protein
LQLVGSSAADAKVASPAGTGAALTEETMQSVINAIAFVVRASSLDKLSVDAFTAALTKKTDFNPARRALFVAAWKAHTKV